MDKPMKLAAGTEVKIFDPRDRATGSDGDELIDPSVALRGEQ